MIKSNFFKQIIASILIIFFLLLAWTYTYNFCFSLILAVLITLIIASSYIEMKIKQKECFRNCYFKDKTLISKIITSPIFTSIFFILLLNFRT